MNQPADTLVCPRCDTELVPRPHCKLARPNCGYSRDCSDGHHSARSRKMVGTTTPSEPDRFLFDFRFPFLRFCAAAHEAVPLHAILTFTFWESLRASLVGGERCEKVLYFRAASGNQVRLITGEAADSDLVPYEVRHHTG